MVGRCLAELTPMLALEVTTITGPLCVDLKDV